MILRRFWKIENANVDLQFSTFFNIGPAEASTKLNISGFAVFLEPITVEIGYKVAFITKKTSDVLKRVGKFCLEKNIFKIHSSGL